MSSIWVVMAKELRDLFRDRRTVLIGLLMGPILAPALLIGMSQMAAKKQATQLEKTLELPVVGGDRAPNLIAWLDGQNVEIKPAPADPEADIREQKHDVILRVDEDFAEAWRGSRPATIELLYDASRRDSNIPVERVEKLLEQYGRTVGALRLLARGIDPAVAAALQVTRQDLSTPEARRGAVLSMMLPYLLILISFLGGAYVIIDVTAGERERQSLEPLLATPAARGAIMSGKIAAAVVFGSISLLLTLVGLKVGFLLAPANGLPFDVSTMTVAKLLFVLLPMLLFGATLLTLISANAKSVKEAQSYMSLLMMLPILPTVVLMVNPVKDQLWMFAVPFLAQNQMITRVVRLEAVSALEWAVYLGAGVGAAAVLWLLAARLYHKERLAISG